MSEDDKHGDWHDGTCHLCRRPCAPNSTCIHCGAVNSQAETAAHLREKPSGEHGYKACYICSYPLDPLSSTCPSCGFSQTPKPNQTQGATNMTDRWNEYSLQGCLFEKTPVAAPMLTAPTGSVPEHVDLRPLCSPVEDQLTTNSCTANAIVGALEYHQRRAKMKTTDMSRLFVYYNARRLSDTEGQDTGSFIHHVMAAVLAHGACEERMWPFEKAMVLTRPTEAAFGNAMNYEAVQYARTELGPNAMAAVAAGLPVVFGTYMPGEYFHEAARTGIMPVDGNQSQRPDGGHAMLIVGYDISEKYWLVRNSWGADWADGGYLRIPFATMKSYSDPSHFWTIGSIEKTSGFGLSGPTMNQMQSSVLAQAPAQMQAETMSMRETLRGELSSGLDDAKKGFRSRLRDK